MLDRFSQSSGSTCLLSLVSAPHLVDLGGGGGGGTTLVVVQQEHVPLMSPHQDGLEGFHSLLMSGFAISPWSPTLQGQVQAFSFVAGLIQSHSLPHRSPNQRFNVSV